MKALAYSAGHNNRNDRFKKEENKAVTDMIKTLSARAQEEIIIRGNLDQSIGRVIGSVDTSVLPNIKHATDDQLFDFIEECAKGGFEDSDPEDNFTFK